jgi:hypothetical protein
MKQHLSPKVKQALAAADRLSLPDKVEFCQHLSAHLAAEIHQLIGPARIEQLVQASSTINQAVKGLQSASHGFRQFKAPNGAAGIQVTITNAKGKEVICLLSNGARHREFPDLPQYGEDYLGGAALIPREDYKAVVKRLLSAIKGLQVVDRVLRIDDADLQETYQMMSSGVRVEGGLSKHTFQSDKKGAVFRSHETFGHGNWDGFGQDYGPRYRYAGFVCRPTKSK